MIRVRTVSTVALFVLALAGFAGAATPTPQAVVDRAVKTAGGMDAFAGLGVIRIATQEEETTEKGKRSTRAFTAYVGTSSLRTMRLELPNQIILGRTGDAAWAQVRGKLDERPQTPSMARGMINAKLFPLLLPFTLKEKGVTVTRVEPDSWDGTPAWRLTVVFEKGFFSSPLMRDPWTIVVSRSDSRLLAAEFHPAEEFSQVSSEGVRYRPLKLVEVGGIRLPSQLLVIGVDANGAEKGHVRVSKLSYQVKPADPTLFINPKKLEALEQGDLPKMPK